MGGSPLKGEGSSPRRAVLSWSGGKDCALTLWHLRRTGRYRIVALVSEVDEDSGQVRRQGVGRKLLRKQTRTLALPLRTMSLPEPCPNEYYRRSWERTLEPLRQEGVRSVVFGDIQLEDVRSFREQLAKRCSLEGVFPLWGKDTDRLAQSFLGSGFRAVVSCVDSSRLDPDWLGEPYDARFLSALPAAVDPCGEWGAFHTFVYDGPLFTDPIRFGEEEVAEQGEYRILSLRAE